MNRGRPRSPNVLLAAAAPYLDAIREEAGSHATPPLSEEEWTRFFSDPSERPKLRGRLAHIVDTHRYLAETKFTRQGDALVPTPDLTNATRAADLLIRLGGLEAPRETKLEVRGAQAADWETLPPEEQRKRIEEAEERIKLLKAGVK